MMSQHRGEAKTLWPDLVHDWASRKDSIDVSKVVAAKMYLEFQCYEDSPCQKTVVL